MSPRYFKDQICDELDGACDYLKKAIDTVATNEDWAEHFSSMADMEQEHATTLYKMFMEMYSASQGKDSYMTQMRDGIMDCFSTKMRKIEDLRTTYNMMDYDDKQEVRIYTPAAHA